MAGIEMGGVITCGILDEERNEIAAIAGIAVIARHRKLRQLGLNGDHMRIVLVRCNNLRDFGRGETLADFAVDSGAKIVVS